MAQAKTIQSSAAHAVILGGGYAGIMAAQRLGAAGVPVTLINNRAHFVERIRLHQLAANELRPVYPLKGLLHKAVQFVQGQVTALDLDNDRVMYRDSAGEHALPYTSLVYALGSRTGDPPGRDSGIYTLDAGSAELLAARLRTLPDGARVVIVGGGLTGIEAAAELAEAYPRLSVTLVTRDSFGANFSQGGRAYLREALERLHVQICDGLNVETAQNGHLVTESGVIPYDVCVWTAGFTVPTLARESGLAVNECGQMLVDPYLRSLSHPHVYGAGDSAFPVESSAPIRMACATAMPLGGHVAGNISAHANGDPQKPFVFRYYSQCISLGRHDGMIQMVNRDDTPSERIIRGKSGTLFKEMICRMTINVLRLEKVVPGLYRIPA